MTNALALKAEQLAVEQSEHRAAGYVLNMERLERQQQVLAAHSNVTQCYSNATQTRLLCHLYSTL